MDNDLIFPDVHQPSRSDAVKNRALLLATAANLFAEHGVEAVTMTAIAEAAGVGKGTLYRHFANKTDLCRALLHQNDQELQNRTLARLRSVCDPLDNLRWFLAEVVRYVIENKALLLVEHTSGIPSLEHPSNWWVRQTIHGLLGQIQPPGDCDYLTDMIYVMTDVNALNFLHRVRGYDTQRITQGLLASLDRLLR